MIDTQSAPRHVLVVDSAGTTHNAVQERFLSYGYGYDMTRADIGRFPTDLPVLLAGVLPNAFLAHRELYQEAVARFAALNRLVQSARQDGFATMLAIAEGVDHTLRSEGEFRAYRDGLNLNREVHTRFYLAVNTHRTEARESDREAWLDIQPAYDGMKEVLYAAQRSMLLFQLTSNGSKHAAELNKRSGLPIPATNVRSAPGGKQKGLEAIAWKVDTPLSELAFVDDSWMNLRECSGAKLVLAGWGYATDANKEEARQAGVSIASTPEELGDVLEWLTGLPIRIRS